ncbi:MAG: GNAT family N-acetyltransferase [Lachnospiraceae bacterium]|jgi:RimJ/RimL family protein N-acetyltransferase|nr:GNAT family N-acetyltransferase [Lachnospiraceae bacterium]
MLKGKQIYLCALEREDLPYLMNWRNQEEFRKYFREYREINSDMQKSWYEKKVLNDAGTVMFAIRNIENAELIGCCGLCYINWIHRNADLSLYIGKDFAYIDDFGYAKESCSLLFNYGFNQLGLEKIWSELYEFDLKKIELYQKVGMQIDGVLRNQYYYEGKWWNSKIFSILNNEWQERRGRID